MGNQSSQPEVKPQQAKANAEDPKTTTQTSKENDDILSNVSHAWSALFPPNATTSPEKGQGPDPKGTQKARQLHDGHKVLTQGELERMQERVQTCFQQISNSMEPQTNPDPKSKSISVLSRYVCAILGRNEKEVSCDKKVSEKMEQTWKDIKADVCTVWTMVDKHDSIEFVEWIKKGVARLIVEENLKKFRVFGTIVSEEMKNRIEKKLLPSIINKSAFVHEKNRLHSGTIQALARDQRYHLVLLLAVYVYVFRYLVEISCRVGINLILIFLSLAFVHFVISYGSYYYHHRIRFSLSSTQEHNHAGLWQQMLLFAFVVLTIGLVLIVTCMKIHRLRTWILTKKEEDRDDQKNDTNVTSWFSPCWIHWWSWLLFTGLVVCMVLSVWIPSFFAVSKENEDPPKERFHWWIYLRDLIVNVVFLVWVSFSINEVISTFLVQFLFLGFGLYTLSFFLLWRYSSRKEGLVWKPMVHSTITSHYLFPTLFFWTPFLFKYSR